MTRYAANDAQIVIAVLSGIATHPLVLEPPIYHPTDVDAFDNPLQMKIGKLRTYAGKELSDVSSLVLSVYPIPRSMEIGVKHSVMSEPYLIGNTHPGDYIDKCKFSLCVELHFFDPIFDAPIEVPVFQHRNYDHSTFHGDAMDYKDGQSLPLPFEELVTPPTILENIDFTPTVSIIPAEEILRAYGSLLRNVIRDQDTFKPWNIRNPCVKWTDYMTTEIFESEDDNLIFHSLKLGIEIEFFETNNARFTTNRIYGISIDSDKTPPQEPPQEPPSEPIDVVSDNLFANPTLPLCRVDTNSGYNITIANIKYYKGTNYTANYAVTNITRSQGFEAKTEIVDINGASLAKFDGVIAGYPSDNIILVEYNEPATTFDNIRPGLYLFTLMLVREGRAIVSIRATFEVSDEDPPEPIV